MAVKTFATTAQKENFKVKLAELLRNNKQLSNNYSVQFFDTLAKSNYVITGLNGKSINVMEHLTVDELEAYKALKTHWQG